MSYPLENCPEYEDLDPQTKAFLERVYIQAERKSFAQFSLKVMSRQIIVLHHKKRGGG